MNPQIRAVAPPPSLPSEPLSHPQSARGQSASFTTRPVRASLQHGPDSTKQAAARQTPKEITDAFNQLSDEMNLDIKFAYNDKIGQVYINVIDKHTGKVIRKLPSDEAMKIAESMKELVGTLFDKKG